MTDVLTKGLSIIKDFQEGRIKETDVRGTLLKAGIQSCLTCKNHHNPKAVTCLSCILNPTNPFKAKNWLPFEE